MNEAQKIIDGLQDVFNLTSGENFEKFKKEAKGNVAEGNSSKAASSGDSSTAASSGYYSKAASSGDSSTAASSGNSSKAASSGDSSTAASSGYYSKAASSGDSSTAASSGYSSKAASSGDSSTAASSGNYSKAASSGDYSKAASSGDSSKAASSGDSSTAASSGYYSKAASSGNYSKAASSGYSSKAASSGYSSKAASSGDSSTAASSGNSSTASATGENVCAFACGRNVMAKASKGGGIALSEYDDKGKLLAVAASIVDGKKLLADEWYKLEDGKFIHVDLSDNIFSRVKSIKKIGGAVVKTVIIDGQKKKSYVYISGGKSAHGVTVEKAKADLRYKIADRDTSKFKAWDKKEKRPLDDLIEAYRVITGACESGTRAYVESQKVTAKKMSIEEVIAATKGAYGNDAFAKFFGEAS